MAHVIKPGDRALFSGVYQVIHGEEHAQTHYVTAVCGDVFPPCQKCSYQVRFEIALSAVHMKVHRHFKWDE
jgi:hypothetical protein